MSLAKKNKYDLLSTIDQGGCSAKLAPGILDKILDKLPKITDKKVLVDIDTHDDAGVYKLNDETAIIFTTDFFPPVCSDAYDFGQIAASNALSDVYAMGGHPLMALNLMMFSSEKMPLEIYSEILAGGHDKVTESGGITIGGHTIEDFPPKFGLAVVGTIHPDKLITNANAKPGDKLILTKPIGIGVIIAAQRLKMVSETTYQMAVDQMKLLNKKGAEIMQKFGVKAATDVTGFGLLGHALKLAEASKLSLNIDLSKLPLLPDAEQLIDDGCIPGAIFRNREYIEPNIELAEKNNFNRFLLANDPQTSGGLLMCAPAEHADDIISELKNSGLHPQASIIGEVVAKKEKNVYVK